MYDLWYDVQPYGRTYLRLQHCVSALWCRDKNNRVVRVQASFLGTNKGICAVYEIAYIDFTSCLVYRHKLAR